MPKLKTNPKTVAFLYASCQTAVSSSLRGITCTHTRSLSFSLSYLSFIFIDLLNISYLLTTVLSSSFPHELSNVSIYFLFNKQKNQQ